MSKHGVTRRSVLRQGLAGALSAGPIVAAARASAADGITAGEAPPLRDAFRGRFLIGTVLNYPALQGKEPRDVEIATRHFSALTPENSMKPDALQRVEGQFTFTDGDRLVEIAEKCGATPIGHTLVWHQQTPAWFFQESFPRTWRRSMPSATGRRSRCSCATGT